MFCPSRVIDDMVWSPTVMAFVFSLLIRSPTFFPNIGSLFGVLECLLCMTRSSAKSRSVSFFCPHTIPKSCPSVVFLITKSITIRKRNGESMHPCLTTVNMLTISVLPSLVLTQQLESLYSALKILMYLEGMPYSSRIFHSESLWMLSQPLQHQNGHNCTKTATFVTA